MPKQEFAARLHQALDSRGAPPRHYGRGAEVARRCGISPTAAAKWLNGESYPDLERAIALAEWLGVSVEWLYTGRGARDVARPDPAISEVVELFSGLPTEQRNAALEFLKFQKERTNNPREYDAQRDPGQCL